MSVINEISSVLQTLNDQKKKNNLDQQRLALEAEKINVQSAKVASQASHFKAQDHLSMAKAKQLDFQDKVLQTEKLGIEQDNIGKKIDNFQKLQPAQEMQREPASFRGITVKPSQGTSQPSSGGPAPSLVQSAPSLQPTSGAGGYPRTSGTEALRKNLSITPQLEEIVFGKSGAEGEGRPGMPPPQVPGLPRPPELQKMKRPSISVEEYDQSLKDYSNSLMQGAQETKRSNDMIKIFNEERSKGMNWVRNQKMKVLQARQNLAQNPPTFKRALNDLSWTQKIGSAIYLFASKSGDPKRYMDEQVAKKLHDLKVEHEAKKNFLDQSDNMYTQFYKIEKDDFRAELDVKATLQEGIKSQIKMFQNRSTSEKERMNLQGYLQVLDNEIAKSNNEVEQSMFDNVKSNITKGFEMRMKAYEAGANQMKESDSAKYSEARQFLGQDTVKIGNLRVFTGENTKKVKEMETSARTVITDEIPQLRGYVSKLRGMAGLKAGKALFTKLPTLGTGAGIKMRRNMMNLNKKLIQLMLKDRIPFTGGGNMNVKELDFLKLFYNVDDSSGRWFLKDTRQLGNVLQNVYTGDYETLFRILEKDRFQQYLREAEVNSEEFKGLDFKDKFTAISESLGLIKKGKATSKYNEKFLKQAWQGYTMNKARR